MTLSPLHNGSVNPALSNTMVLSLWERLRSGGLGEEMINMNLHEIVACAPPEGRFGESGMKAVCAVDTRQGGLSIVPATLVEREIWFNTCSTRAITVCGSGLWR